MQILIGLGVVLCFTFASIHLKLLTENWSSTSVTIVIAAASVGLFLEYHLLKRTEFSHATIVYALADIGMGTVFGLYVWKETLTVYHLASLMLVIAAAITISLAPNT
jgi:multidrug transporter EmrE-like cation transporter